MGVLEGLGVAFSSKHIPDPATVAGYHADEVAMGAVGRT
jgi:hypothetical protein